MAIYTIVITWSLHHGLSSGVYISVIICFDFLLFNKIWWEFFSEIHSYWPRKWTDFVETVLRQLTRKTHGRNRPMSIKYHILDFLMRNQSIFKAKRILNRYSLDVGYIPNLVTFMRYAKCSPIGQFLDWHFPKDKSPMYIFPTDTHISQNGHFPEGHCPIGRTFPWPYVLARCFS